MIGANHEYGRYVVAVVCDGCGLSIVSRQQAGSATYLHNADVPSRIWICCSARCRVEIVERRNFQDYVARPLNELTGRIDWTLSGNGRPS